VKKSIIKILKTWRNHENLFYREYTFF